MGRKRPSVRYAQSMKESIQCIIFSLHCRCAACLVLTCFSKALGTSLRSSLRLLLILSRRRFSMICRKTRRAAFIIHPQHMRLIRFCPTVFDFSMTTKVGLYSLLDAFSVPAPEWRWWETLSRGASSCSFRERKKES